MLLPRLRRPQELGQHCKPLIVQQQTSLETLHFLILVQQSEDSSNCISLRVLLINGICIKHYDYTYVCICVYIIKLLLYCRKIYVKLVVIITVQHMCVYMYIYLYYHISVIHEACCKMFCDLV